MTERRLSRTHHNSIDSLEDAKVEVSRLHPSWEDHRGQLKVKVRGRGSDQGQKGLDWAFPQLSSFSKQNLSTLILPNAVAIRAKNVLPLFENKWRKRDFLSENKWFILWSNSCSDLLISSQCPNYLVNCLGTTFDILWHSHSNFSFAALINPLWNTPLSDFCSWKCANAPCSSLQRLAFCYLG